MADNFVFNAELLFRSNGEQFVREVRAMFKGLQDESRRLLATGSQTQIAGVPARYAAALGQVGAVAAAKPGLSERQQTQVSASLRGAEATYASLQVTAKD